MRDQWKTRHADVLLSCFERFLSSSSMYASSRSMGLVRCRTLLIASYPHTQIHELERLENEVLRARWPSRQVLLKRRTAMAK
jgi:hypothetical protein